MISINNKYMKNLTILVLIAGLLGITGCCIDNMCDPDYNDQDYDDQDEQVSKDYLEKVAIENRNALDLSAVNGDIRIIGESNINMVTVEAKLIASAETEGLAQQYLEKLDIDVFKEQSKIRIVSKHPDSNHQNAGTAIHYTITIPNTWKVDIDHTNGKIDISDIQNDLDIVLTNGIFNMEDISGSVVAKIVNGNITGNMILESEGTCHLKSVNGGIDLEIPKNTSADFNARVTNGSIQISGLEISKLESDAHYARGQLGDGNGEILLDLLNGQIKVQGY